MTIVYPVTTPVGEECLPGYANLVSGLFDNIDAALSQRCSASVQVFVRFLDARFYSFRSNVLLNIKFLLITSQYGCFSPALGDC